VTDQYQVKTELNLTRTIMNNYQFVISVLAGFVLPLLASGANTPLKSTTALMILPTGDYKGRALEIRKVEFESPVAYKVIVPDGQELTFLKDRVAALFYYPDPSVALTGPADIQRLQLKRDEAVALGKRFTDAKSFLDPIARDIDIELEKLAGGQIRLGGFWQSAKVLTDATKANAPKADLASLTYKGLTYQNVQITRLDNGSIMLKHDGGLLRVHLAEGPADLLTATRNKSELFRATVPLEEIVLGITTLRQVVLMGTQGETLTLLHQGGVTSVARSRLSEPQMELLASSNPAVQIQPASLTNHSVMAASGNTDATLLPRAQEEDRRPGLGWQAGRIERELWLAVGSEAYAEPTALLEEWKVNRSALDPEVAEQFSPYADTLAFINSKILDGFSLGYSAMARCLVLKHSEHNYTTKKPEVIVVAAFNPGLANAVPNIKQDDYTTWVQLEGHNGAEIFAFYIATGKKGEEPVLWRNHSLVMRLPVRDLHDAERAGKALSQLILMLGGKPSKF